MIFPIGHDRTEVRRLPGVTLTIAILCISVFLWSQLEGARVERSIEAAAAELRRDFEAHPYLDLDARAERLLFGPDPEVREGVLRALRAGARRPLLPYQARAAQARLTALEEALFERVDRHPLRRFGLQTARPRPQSWISYAFLHVDPLHLLGNLLLLLLAGLCVEECFGRTLFAGLYLGSAVASAAIFLQLEPGLETPLVGASGAIAGVMGAFAVRCGATRIRFFYWILVSGTFSAPAWLMLPLWFGNEWVSALWLDRLHPGAGGGGGVAHWAHVGGFVFGAAFALVVRLLRIEERWIDPAIESRLTFTENTALEHALELGSRGDPQAALEALASELRRAPDNYEAAVAYWDQARVLGCPLRGAPALARLVDRDLQRGELALALRHVRELAESAPEFELRPALLARLATELGSAGQAGEAASVWSLCAGREAAGLTPLLALRAARALARHDPERAARIARATLDREGLDPSLAGDLESLVGALAPTWRADSTAREATGAPEPRTGGVLEALDLGAEGPVDSIELDPNATEVLLHESEPFEGEGALAPLDLEGELEEKA
ncbi:MAG: rhomboid family intramembrane serine protease [Myxococcota bacterium]